MHAMSFVGTVGVAEAQLAGIGDQRRFDDAGPLARRVWRAFDATADLVELAVATFPLPALSRPSSAAADEAIRSIIETTYERDGRPPEADDVTGDLAAARDRLDDVGVVIVPLPADGPAAANWYVLYSWLGDRLDTVSRDLRRLSGRLERAGRTTFAEALDGLRGVVTDLRRLVGHAGSVTDWIAPPDDVDEETLSLRRTAAELVTTLSNER